MNRDTYGHYQDRKTPDVMWTCPMCGCVFACKVDERACVAIVDCACGYYSEEHFSWKEEA